MPYTQHINRLVTPQTLPVPGRKDQVQNNAGGFVFEVTPMQRLLSFLILGSESGTYYVSERDLTVANVDCVEQCLNEAPGEAMTLIGKVSMEGRAPKNDPAILALALASVHKDDDVRRMAYVLLPKVCRIGTHLMQFVSFRKALGGGGGRGYRKALSDWYTTKEPGRLGYQLLKYRNRHGWTHRDILRVARPKVEAGSAHEALLAWACGNAHEASLLPAQLSCLAAVNDVNPKSRGSFIKANKLPREALPTEWLNDPGVWDAMLDDMPLGALIRNLGNLGKHGVLKPLSERSNYVADKLMDPEGLKRARIHPLGVLLAGRAYADGQGRHGEWEPCDKVIDALNEAFTLAFKTVTPAGKRFLLGIDVSGSMWFTRLAGSSVLVGDAAAAMALITARTEPETHTMLFDTKSTGLRIGSKATLAALSQSLRGPRFGQTDCAQPMLYAMNKGIDVDCFVVYTDNETYVGDTHPYQALNQYRQKTGINARLVVCGMTSNGFSIADPKDPGMLDVVGFDASTPQVLSAFAAG